MKEGLWDDVIRKAALERGRYKPKPAELSTEKSSMGLGEQYAQEYEQQIYGNTPAETAAVDKAHQEVSTPPPSAMSTTVSALSDSFDRTI